ncbi:phosphatidate cytidylyltransferase [Mariprofundus micogutta]|uniref:Phosphatidate cytidylyltransferase n=1 Tax=Mariprofundus micogutta TaxID=1921010 RepID=A0A1L8CK06_9PROT|nr:phosphatidate cytidylyltransferase [Mariprofundus micogutta]GAV19199.1 phosphatidate cytidylyltransferase [Mariprofundus micogutta]
MSELSKRIITAIVLFVAVWGWYFHLASPWFESMLALIGLVASCEAVLMMKLRQPLAYMLSAAVMWGLFAWSADIGWLLLGGFIWFFVFVLNSRLQQASFSDFFAAVWLLSWVYVFALAIAETHNSAVGQSLIIGTCLAVWTSDTAAYFVGRKWGSRKLCPAISPGKSIEGVMGALLFAVPVAMFCWVSWDVLPAGLALILALVAVIAGVLGDLSESSVKRMAGAKDSGSWLPGHGGILDRIDAIIMAVPVTWLLWGLI